MKNYILYVLLASLISGCGTFSQSLVAQKTAMSIPILKSQQPDSREKANEMITLPVQLRVVHIKYDIEGNGYSICAEPMPDVAMSDSFRNALGITAGTKITVNDDLQTTTAALALEGRTQLVLLARDFLYRTCEFGINGWLEKDDVKRMYSQILKHITALVEAEKKSADATANVAKAVLAKTTLDAKILEETDKVKISEEKKFLISEYDKCKAEAEDDKARAKCESDLMTQFP
ncbi:hypothetical protein [Nitrosospira sp. Nsp11]|uniref:hypothetical protein n=1 Tax=Nitrosospira sp. Nsp11 TaxID=1855338 RepID=UPI0011604671|nr:hypothetical protein [Nitrosospira sp. Nsp11]